MIYLTKKGIGLTKRINEIEVMVQIPAENKNELNQLKKENKMVEFFGLYRSPVFTV